MIRKIMDAIYQRVAGLDAHQETVVACRRRLIGNGQAKLEIKTFFCLDFWIHLNT